MERSHAEILKIKDIVNSEYHTFENEPGYLEVNNKKIYRVLIYGVVVNKSESSYTSLLIDDGTANIEIRTFENFKILDEIDIGDFIIAIGRIREYGRKYVLGEVFKKANDEKWFKFIDLLKEKVIPIEKNNKNYVTNNHTQNTEQNQLNTHSIQTQKQKDTIITTTQSKQKNIGETEIEDKRTDDEKEQNKIEEINVSQIETIDVDSDDEKANKNNISINQEETYENNSNNEIKESLLKKAKQIESKFEKVNSLLKIISQLDNGDGAEYDDISNHFESNDLDDLLMRLLESGDIYEFRPKRYRILE